MGAYAVSKRRCRSRIGYSAGEGDSDEQTQDTGRRDIVLIHGLWMNLEELGGGWAERFRDRGHAVHVPSWPGLDGEPEDLRRDPSRVQHEASSRSSTTTRG